mmetsp:Transcript_39747/g.124863  ORF Transcript_39747/g.124863 Transcript_39747/m.124863 type:complete len:236 (+) Transcript_39747:374-1081(+)
MILVDAARGVSQDAASVLLHLLRDAHPADDGPSCRDLCQHGHFSAQLPVGFHTEPLEAGDGRADVGAEGGKKGAGLADSQVATFEVLGLIGLAGLVGYILLLHPLVRCRWVSSPAASGLVGSHTVDENLSGEDIARKRVVSHQVDSIAQSAGGREGPARAAVGRNVLVPVRRRVAHPREVSNVPTLRDPQRADFLSSHLPHLLPPPSADATRVPVVVISSLLHALIYEVASARDD